VNNRHKARSSRRSTAQHRKSAASAGGLEARLPPVEPSPFSRRLALALACAAVAFFVFLPTLGFEFVDWDDTGVLVNNPDWRGLGSEQLKWMFTTNHYGHYQPVTWLTYGVDYVIWGMNPRGYHLSNALFHAANALLVWFLASFLLRRALPTLASASNGWLLDLAASFAGLAFAAHPLRVESVAWVTERRDLVSAFLILLTILAYLRFTNAEGRARVGWYIGTIVVYVASMLAKVGGAPLPLVLLVLDWYPLRRLEASPARWFNTRTLKVLGEKVPFLLVSLAFSVATLQQQAGRWLITLEMHSLEARIAQAFYGTVFYVWKTIVPTGLSPLYELRFPLDPYELRFFICAGIVIVLGGLLLWKWRRLQAVLAAALAYGLMVGPLLGFFQNGHQIVADRYSYLSTLGFAILIAGAAAVLVHRRPSAQVRTVVAALALASVFALSVLTVRQSLVWRDTGTLWKAVLDHDPNSSFGNNSYGYVLLARGEIDTAEELFRRALALNRHNRQAQHNLAEALQRKGVGRIEAYIDALSYNRDQHTMWYELANALLDAQRNQEAVEAYLQALRFVSDEPRYHTNLAIALARLDRLDEAERHYRIAAEIRPAQLNARDGLAHVLTRQGRITEAKQVLEALLQENPGYEQSRRRLDLLNRNFPRD
jgi:protein O-mannosyl-transferase